MEKIIYSSTVSLILHIFMFYFCWTYWSLPLIIFWALFIVLYTEKRYNWKKFKNSQKW
jgi:hypothetical protein